jgi:methylated-DNA-[protein]-cysteine S-methyltransferase
MRTEPTPLTLSRAAGASRRAGDAHAIKVASPVGSLTLDERDGRIVSVSWGQNMNTGAPTPLLAEAARQLDAYFAGRLRTFDLPLDPAGSAFQRRVWAAMEAIPYGGTRSYGEIAAELASAARAVGGACGKNPIPVIIPCHRVLAAGRGLGGYSGAGGLETKRALLALEGAI